MIIELNPFHDRSSVMEINRHHHNSLLSIIKCFLKNLENFENLLWFMSIAQACLLGYTCFLFIKFAKDGKKVA